MTKYINYNDLSLTFKPTGEIVFNTELIYDKMSRSFVMPQWIKSDIDKILNSSKFEGIVNVSDVRKITSDAVVELNNKLVPLARANALKNSVVAELIDFGKLYEGSDIALVFPNVDTSKDSFTDNILVDMQRVFNKFKKLGVELREEEKEALLAQIRVALDVLDESYSVWTFVSQKHFEEAVEEIRNRIVEVINMYLLEVSSAIALRYMMDTEGLVPYFTYEHGGDGISYDMSRIYYLMSAMGYKVDYNGDDQIDAYIKLLIAEIEEELLRIEAVNFDKDAVSNLSSTVNLSLINRIKFVSDNQIPLTIVGGIRYPEVLMTQLELETVYFDECVKIMTPDEILNDLQGVSGVPRIHCHDYVDIIISELKGIFKEARSNDTSVELIFRCITRSYDDLLNIHSAQIKKKFGQNGIVQKRNSTIYRTHLPTNSSFGNNSFK